MSTIPSEKMFWQILFECFLETGADPSDYTPETRTAAGRAAGARQFRLHGGEVDLLAAIRELRERAQEER